MVGRLFGYHTQKCFHSFEKKILEYLNFFLGKLDCEPWVEECKNKELQKKTTPCVQPTKGQSNRGNSAKAKLIAAYGI